MAQTTIPSISTFPQPEARQPASQAPTDGAREHLDDNAGYLPALTAECERLGLTLKATDDPTVGMPQIEVIDGTRTLLARADELGVALDDARAVGRCIECSSDLDDTALPYFPANALPGYRVPKDITGGDIRICRTCVTRSRLPLTAAQRGPEWAAKWGCPGFCVENHGTPGANECHSTSPAETSILAADMDCSGYSANGEGLPWLTAQTVVVNDKSQAYGRRTAVWLGYGVHLAELSPTEARAALDSLRAFTVRLAAVVDFAEQTAAEDFAGDPEIACLDSEATERRVRTVSEGRR
jgi:hypothetical protein